MTVFQQITNYKMQSLASSVFTCTQPGLYKFQAYSLTRTDKSLYLDMYQNDVIVASLWARTPHDYAAAGNAVILDLATGDTVQVNFDWSVEPVTCTRLILRMGNLVFLFPIYLQHPQKMI